MIGTPGSILTLGLGGSPSLMATLGYGIGAYVEPEPTPLSVYGNSGYWPSPKRRTKKEIDDERRERLGLSIETIDAVAEVPKARRKLVLADLVGKQRAAEITQVDLTEAIAATKRRKRRQEDELLLMM